MKDKILKAFPKCVSKGCFSIINHDFFKVFDRDDECCFICTENEPSSLSYFKVNNPSKKDLHFLAIDKCLIVSDEKKCDCAIFDEKIFYFVEIKTSNTRQRSARRCDAFEQLKSTLNIFTSSVDFDGYEINAQICIGNTGTYPRRSSSQMGRAIELLTLFNAKLVEGNLIEF